MDDEIFDFVHVLVSDLRPGMMINYQAVRGSSSENLLIISCVCNKFDDSRQNPDALCNMQFIVLECLSSDGNHKRLVYDLSFDPDVMVRVFEKQF